MKRYWYKRVDENNDGENEKGWSRNDRWECLRVEYNIGKLIGIVMKVRVKEVIEKRRNEGEEDKWREDEEGNKLRYMKKSM